MERDFQLEVERSGGVAGMSLKASVDAAELTDEELHPLAELLERTGRSRRRRSAPPPGPDRFQYDMTISRGRRRRHVSLAEGDVPPALRPLLDRLVERARSGPGPESPGAL